MGDYDEEPPPLLNRWEDPNPRAHKVRKLVAIVSAVLPEVDPAAYGLEPSPGEGYSHRQQTRWSVNDIFNEQRPTYVRMQMQLIDY